MPTKLVARSLLALVCFAGATVSLAPPAFADPPQAPVVASPPTNAKIQALQAKFDDMSRRIDTLAKVLNSSVKSPAMLQARLEQPGLLLSRAAIGQQIARERATLANGGVPPAQVKTGGLGTHVVTSYGVSSVGAGVPRSPKQENAALWHAAGSPPLPRATTSDLRRLYLQGGPGAIGAGRAFGR